MSLPQPSGEFEWVQESWGTALRCRPLAGVARHCFSTRELHLEGVRAGAPAGWAALANALGVELDSLVRMRQVHCADVFEARRENGVPLSDWPEADIAVTDDPSVALSVRAADCVPILLADRRSRRGGSCSCRLEGHRRGRGDRSRAIVDVAISHQTGRRHCCRWPEYRAVLLRGRRGTGESLLVARRRVDMVLTRREAASQSLARHARPVSARRSSGGADSCVRALHIRPSCAVSLVPPRRHERRQTRRCDQKRNRYETLKKRARAVAVYRSSSTSSSTLPKRDP